MHTATQPTAFDLPRVGTCASLATLTTLGMFSLIASVMPIPAPAAGEAALARSPETVCVPAARAMQAAAPAHKAI